MIKQLLAITLCLFTMSVQSRVIVDVRTLDEIAQTGKVQGALTADMRSADFFDKFNSFNIPKHEEVILYCRSGRRAQVVQQALEQQGYKNVKNFGGYEEASEKLGLPLVK